mmetsp:Transcript_96373/g.162184  ORF Transcript_96373/g.162184 Transcript_96373/m.162184 type:complete len:139 (-) Transcript_96373:1158-1574(-)
MSKALLLVFMLHWLPLFDILALLSNWTLGSKQRAQRAFRGFCKEQDPPPLGDGRKRKGGHCKCRGWTRPISSSTPHISNPTFMGLEEWRARTMEGTQTEKLTTEIYKLLAEEDPVRWVVAPGCESSCRRFFSSPALAF